MRLIDVEPLINECKVMIDIEWNHKVSPVSWADAEEEFITRLEEAPTVDPIHYAGGCYCRECEYGKESWTADSGEVFYICKNPKIDAVDLRADDFCSYGRRRACVDG